MFGALGKKAQAFVVPLLLLAVVALMAAPLVYKMAKDDSFSVGGILAPQAIAPMAGGVQSPTDAKAEPKAKLDFFIMSYCPYGRQYVQQILPGLIAKYGNDLDWTPRYIVSIANNVVSSMHGQQEVDENMREVCIRDETGKAAWYTYVSCFYGGGEYENCLAAAKVEKAKVEDCFSNRAKGLIAKDFDLSVKYDARASPTSVVNDGEKTVVGFSATKINQAVEQAVTGQVVQDAKVSLVVLTDSTCPVCNPAKIISQLKDSVFTNLNVVTMDYQTAEGKKFMQDLGIRMLPAYVFDKSVEKSSGFADMKQYFVPLKEYYVLGVESNYFPAREKIPSRVDLFVMSQCPYGTKAEAAMKEVLGALGDQITFNLHYIASEENGVISSMHGDTEVVEDIRQLCMYKNYPAKAFDYILCRNEDLNKDWTTCLKDVDQLSLMGCIDGPEGKALLSADIKLADSLGFQGSPTFLINNQMYFTGALPADEIKNIVCEANDGLQGCEKALTSTSSVPQGAGCG